MKRDLDLIRKLLLKMEEHEHGYAPQRITLDGYTDEQVGFHIYLLGQAGLICVADSSSMESGSPSAIPLNLTWAGYEFLDAARDETLWEKAKAKVINPVGGVAFGILIDWLKAEARNRLGIPM